MDGWTAISGHLEDKTGYSFPRCGWGIEKVMIYQFIPVLTRIVETSLKLFLHSLRSVVIDEVAEANTKEIDEVAEAQLKKLQTQASRWVGY